MILSDNNKKIMNYKTDPHMSELINKVQPCAN